MGTTPQAPPLALSPEQSEDVYRRLVRIETRLCRLLTHLGLQPDGNQPEQLSLPPLSPIDTAS